MRTKDKKATLGHGSEETTKRHRFIYVTRMRYGQPNVLLQRSNRIWHGGKHQHRAEHSIAIHRAEGWVGKESAVLTRFSELAWLTGTASPMVKTYWEIEDRP